MKNMLCSLIIPISGDIPKLDSLKKTLKNASGFESEIEIILLFDVKESKISARNQAEIQSWKFANVNFHSDAFSSVGAARNFGISIADSKWITFTDADDVNDVQNFISMIREAERHNSDIAIGKFNSRSILSGTTSSAQRRVWNSETFQVPFGLNPGIWRCAFRVTSLNNIRFPNLSMAEDQVFIARYFVVERKIHFSDLIVYDYFVGGKNSLTNKIEQVRKISDAIPISVELIRENNGPYLNLLETLVLSQIVSGIKYGNIKAKIALLARILRFLSSAGLVSMFRRALILFKVAHR